MRLKTIIVIMYWWEALKFRQVMFDKSWLSVINYWCRKLMMSLTDIELVNSVGSETLDAETPTWDDCDDWGREEGESLLEMSRVGRLVFCDSKTLWIHLCVWMWHEHPERKRIWSSLHGVPSGAPYSFTMAYTSMYSCRHRDTPLEMSSRKRHILSLTKLRHLTCLKDWICPVVKSWNTSSILPSLEIPPLGVIQEVLLGQQVISSGRSLTISLRDFATEEAGEYCSGS
jgi:hypothetical protein